MSIELQPVAGNTPGHAELRVEPWNGGADGVEICIQRNDGTPYLCADGQWSSNPQWLQVTGAWLEGSGLRLNVGPAFVDPLLASPSRVFRGTLREQGGKPAPHALTLSTDLLSSAAAGFTPSAGDTGNLVGTQKAVAEPVVEPVMAAPVAPVIEPELAPEPQPVVTDEIKAERPAMPPVAPRSSPWLKIGAGVLVLLAAGYFAWTQFGATKEEPVPEKVVEAKPAAAACSLESLASANELSFVQDCIRDVKDSAALLAIIQAARDKSQCGIAQRLYANRAQAGDNVIALAYAKEYDPKFHQPNACFAKPDAATAAYWYEAVLDRDATNETAKTRLAELQK